MYLKRASLLAVMASTVFVVGGTDCGTIFGNETQPTSIVTTKDPVPKAITVATWNLEWFFDDFKSDNQSDLSKEQSAPNRAEWEWKLEQVSGVIAKIRPTILCLQEVENRDTLRKLVLHLRENHELFYRIAFIQGLDFFTEQDVAILYQSGLVQYSRREQSREMWDSKQYYNLQKHLLADFEWGSGADKEKLYLMNVHLRAGDRGLEFRERQCKLVHEWMKERIAAGENVIITGDFNTSLKFGEEKPDSDISFARGLGNNTKSDDLFDLHEHLRDNLRTTHIAGSQFDRILVSQSLLDDTPDRRDLVFSRIVTRKDLVVRGKGVDDDHYTQFYKIAQRERDISDHYPVLAEFLFK